MDLYTEVWGSMSCFGYVLGTRCALREARVRGSGRRYTRLPNKTRPQSKKLQIVDLLLDEDLDAKSRGAPFRALTSPPASRSIVA